MELDMSEVDMHKESNVEMTFTPGKEKVNDIKSTNTELLSAIKAATGFTK